MEEKSEKLFDNMHGMEVTGSFELQTDLPLDGRLVVEEVGDLTKLIEEDGAYEGMEVYIKEIKTTYRLIQNPNDSNPPSNVKTVIAKTEVKGVWLEVIAGGSSENAVVFIDMND